MWRSILTPEEWHRIPLLKRAEFYVSCSVKSLHGAIEVRPRPERCPAELRSYRV